MCSVLQFAVLVLVIQVTAGFSTSQKIAAESAIKDLVGSDLLSLIPPIPDQSFKDGKVTDIKITGLTLPTVKITESSTSINVNIANFGLTATANWSAKKKILFITLRAKGSIKASASGVGVDLTINKRPLKVTSCRDWIGNLDVDIKGKNIAGKLVSWIAKVFKKLVERKLKEKLSGKICDGATKLVEKHASKISGLLGL